MEEKNKILRIIISRMENEIISILTIGKSDMNKEQLSLEKINDILLEKKSMINTFANNMYNDYCQDDDLDCFNTGTENDWYREYIDMEKIDY